MDGALEVQVTRGQESWTFFAFVFSAFVTLGLSLINDFVLFIPLRATLKIIFFALCAYLLLRNAWVRNKLVSVRGWLAKESKRNV